MLDQTENANAVPMTLTEASRPSTVGDLMELYQLYHCRFLKNPGAEARVLRHYVSRLASRPLATLTRLEVMAWYQDIGQALPGAANQALAVLRSMFNKAREWEVYAGSNPVSRIKKFPQRARTRFVQPEEMPRLLTALAKEPELFQTYFLLLLMTGARRTEAATAKWSEFDLDRGYWHKPNTKTGTAHTVPIPPPIIVRLAALPRRSEFVFAGRYRGTHQSLCRLEQRWQRIRARAGLEDVRIHDLRRTCASWLAISGENLSVIQKVLGHTNLQHTSIYARLTIEPVQQALTKQAAKILELTPAPQPEPAQSQEALQEWPG